MRYEYHYIDMSAIHKLCTEFREELKKQNLSEKNIDNLVNQSFYDMLSEMYLNCAIHNQETNVKKQKNHEKFIKTYIISVIILVFSYLSNVLINGLIIN